MKTRLTSARLAEIRAEIARATRSANRADEPMSYAMKAAADLLVELDATRAERDAAIQRANELPGLTAALDEARWECNVAKGEQTAGAQALAEIERLRSEVEQLKTLAGTLGEVFGQLKPETEEGKRIVARFDSTVGEFFDGELPTPVKEAEERGRTVERADVFAHLRAYSKGYGRDPSFQVAARLLKAFAVQLERGEHVGAAARAEQPKEAP